MFAELGIMLVLNSSDHHTQHFLIYSKLLNTLLLKNLVLCEIVSFFQAKPMSILQNALHYFGPEHHIYQLKC